MPARTANVSEEVYQDINKEMNITGKSYSAVINRRLEKLIELEGRVKE